MEWQELLAELVKFMQEAAPAVWAIARRQALVVGVQNAVGAVICLCATAILWRIAYLLYKKEEGENWIYKEYDTLALAISIFSLVSCILCVGFTLSAIGCIVNPDYYAIKLLLDLVAR